jgi:hypothetical protein
LSEAPRGAGEERHRPAGVVTVGFAGIGRMELAMARNDDITED